MKKIVKDSLVVFATLSLGTLSVNAKTLNATELRELAKQSSESDTLGTQYSNLYILGNHVYKNYVTIADLASLSSDTSFKSNAKYPDLYYFDGTVASDNDKLTNAEEKSLEITNAIQQGEEEKLTPPDKDYEVEMVRFVGELEGNDYLSENKDIYDEDYLDRTETKYLGQGERIVEMFVDESAALSILDIKPVTNSDIGENTNIHKYNTGSLDVKFENNVLTLTEKAPLLSYLNGSEKTEQWFALLVKTNKEVKEDNEIILSIQNGDTIHEYEILADDILGASDHGAGAKEFVVWFNAHEFIPESEEATVTLTIKENENAEAQTITVNYDAKFKVYEYVLSEAKTLKVDETRSEGISVTEPVVINGEYHYIFYSDADFAEDAKKEVFFYENEDAKSIFNNGTAWKVSDVFQVENRTDVVVAEKAKEIDGAGGTATKANKWNQDGLTISQFVPNTEEPEEEKTYDYLVTISTKKVLEKYKRDGSTGNEATWIPVVLDLGINPTNVKVNKGSNWEAIPEADINEVKTGYTANSFATWLEFNEDTKEITLKFRNTNKSDLTPEKDTYTDDVITVKFKLDENPTNVELVNVKKSEAANIDSLIPGNADDTERNKVFKENIGALELEATENEKYFTQDENGKYIITLQASKPLSQLTGNNEKLYALVVDFGIDPENLTIDTTKTYGIIVDENKARFGATGTEFVVVLNGSVDDIGVTNNLTGVKAILQVTLKEVQAYEDNDLSIYDTVSADKVNVIYGDAKYIGEGKFMVNNGTQYFIATVGEAKYAYSVQGGNKLTRTKSMNIKVYDPKAALTSEEPSLSLAEQIKHNINVMTVTKTENTSEIETDIEVEFNKDLGTVTLGSKGKAIWYPLVIDTGILNTNVNVTANYTLEQDDKDKAYLYAGVTEEIGKNYIVIWLKETETRKENGYSLTLHDTANPNVKYTIHVHSTRVANEDEEHPDLAIQEETSVSLNTELLTEENFDSSELFDGKLASNNEAITVKGVDPETGNVILEFNKPIDKYNNNTGNRHWFGFLFDLGIDPKYLTIEDEGYSFNPDGSDTDPEQVKRFGGSGTQFLLWFDMDLMFGVNTSSDWKVTKPIYKLRFRNKTPGNNYNTIEVTFELRNAIKPLEVQDGSGSILTDDLATVDNIETIKDSDVAKAVYQINQSKFSTRYDSETKELVISELAKDATAGDYVIDGTTGKWIAVVMDLGFDKKYLSVQGSQKQDKAYYIIDKETDLGSDTKFILYVRANVSTVDPEFINEYNQEKLTVDVTYEKYVAPTE